ncbi:hypothetical protein HY091_02680 [Candidatus Kaiserbacteria bacterium]|nr:hypothetical protein [Candidatus Kaiserbacteria bacterium]
MRRHLRADQAAARAALTPEIDLWDRARKENLPKIHPLLLTGIVRKTIETLKDPEVYTEGGVVAMGPKGFGVWSKRTKILSGDGHVLRTAYYYFGGPESSAEQEQSEDDWWRMMSNVALEYINDGLQKLGLFSVAAFSDMENGRVSLIKALEQVAQSFENEAKKGS